MVRVAVLLLSGVLNGGPHEWTWDFDMDPLGKPPPGFYFDVTDVTGEAPEGKWEVVKDGESQVLAQLDPSLPHRRYPLAVAKDVWLKDVKISVRMKAVDGHFDQTGGVVWRYRNSENYLVARLDMLERNVRLYRFDDGNRVHIAVKGNLDVKKDQWYTIRVEHVGREVRVYLDDEVLFIERDKHFHRPGKVALWTKADSVVYFDDFHAEKLADPDDKAHSDDQNKNKNDDIDNDD